jgi:hypothetical protein
MRHDARCKPQFAAGRKPCQPFPNSFSIRLLPAASRMMVAPRCAPLFERARNPEVRL